MAKFAMLNAHYVDTANYAERWSPEILQIIIEGSLTAPFIRSNVEWMLAKTFHFTQMKTSGYKTHNRATKGFNAGKINQVDVPFTVEHDRDIEFYVDVADEDETNLTLAAAKVARTFTKTQHVPEIDALFFSRVASEAVDAGLFTEQLRSFYTKDNIYSELKKALIQGRIRLYKKRDSGGICVYLPTELMDHLEQSTDFTRRIEVTQVMNTGSSKALETRVTSIDGTPILEVVEDERFYDSFDFDGAVGGFAPESAVSKQLNFMICARETCRTVIKIHNIYLWAPNQVGQGDGWMFQTRAWWDTFVFPNGLDNTIDSVYISRSTTAVA